MNRRTLLKSGGALGSGLISAGCLSRLGFETQSAWRDPPLVQDRPDGVYYPAIIEGMGIYGTTTAGDIGFALMHSFPHRFWNLTGTNKTKVVVQSSDSLHLMASVWDVESNTVLPVDISVEIRSGDEQVTNTNLWPMLSPNMGFHYGDNVGLPGEGSYEVTLRVGPLQTNRSKPFEGKFTEPQSVTMSFSFDTSETYNLEYRRLREKGGTRGAVELMEMGPVPSPVAPKRSALPGREIGKGSSDDATFLATVVEGESRFSEDDRPYLIVSPRTPYNRVVLPRMTLRTRIERDGETVFQGPLQASLDPKLSCYYGTSVPPIESGDTITVDIQTPPQLARHDGYETAFIDMSKVEFVV